MKLRGVGRGQRPNHDSLLGDRKLLKQSNHDNVFISISRSKLYTSTEYIQFHKSLLERISLTQKNSSTGGILNIVGGHLIASQIIFYIGWPTFPTWESSFSGMSFSINAQESAREHWSRTAATHGPWFISPLQSRLIKTAQSWLPWLIVNLCGSGIG